MTEGASSSEEGFDFGLGNHLKEELTFLGVGGEGNVLFQTSHIALDSEDVDYLKTV